MGSGAAETHFDFGAPVEYQVRIRFYLICIMLNGII